MKKTAALQGRRRYAILTSAVGCVALPREGGGAYDYVRTMVITDHDAYVDCERRTVAEVSKLSNEKSRRLIRHAAPFKLTY